jgi:hypothetical protein
MCIISVATLCPLLLELSSRGKPFQMAGKSRMPALAKQAMHQPTQLSVRAEMWASTTAALMVASCAPQLCSRRDLLVYGLGAPTEKMA